MKLNTAVFVTISLFLVQYLTIVEAKEGSYIAIPRWLKNCERPSFPYENHPTVILSVELYNTSRKINLMRGNVTVTKENKKLKMFVKCFKISNGIKKLVLFMNNLSCSSPAAAMILRGTGFLTNSHPIKDCTLPVGVYKFDNTDLNHLMHLWRSQFEYGTIMWKSEILSQGKTIMCMENNVAIMPVSVKSRG